MNASQPPESEPLGDAEDHRLQQLFRDQSSEYIADVGFTAQVLGKLPAARERRQWRRRGLVGGAVLLGGAMVAICGGHDLMATLAGAWTLLGEWSAHPVPGLGALATVGSVVVLVGSLVVGWWGYARAE